MSAAKIGKTGEQNNSFGSSRSTESKAKMRAAKLGGSLTLEHRAKIRAAAPRGERHTNWRGGRTITDDHYVTVRVGPEHPFVSMAVHGTSGGSFIREHRLVMAESLGRPLASKEVVHHRLVCEGGSGDTLDNRIENLRLFPSQSLHLKHHAALRAAGGE